MSKTTIIYKDIAPGAADDATVSGTNGGGNLAQLPFGVTSEKFLTLEPSRWILDGGYAVYDESETGFWSTEVSDANGNFAATPTITLEFSQQFSSTGIQITFDEATGEYCNEVEISWYQGSILRRTKAFQPNSTVYFCECRVESYDKVVIALKRTAVPYRRARVNEILMGVYRTYGMSEIRTASIVNQANESGVELPVSTLNWTLDSAEDLDYLFQLKQPIEVWNDNRHLGTYYIDSAARSSARVYVIECQDALGVLEYTAFSGGAYLSGVSAKTLLCELASPFTVEFAEDVEDTTLYGLLNKGTARSAIQQIVFAWGVMLATDGGDVLRVFNQPSIPTLIPKGRTFVGGTVETQAMVTKVTVIAHTYAEDSNGSIEINGTKYSDAQTEFTAINPDVTANTRENTKEVKSATLVSPEIAQAVADRLYKYYALRDTNTAKVVYGGEKLGDCVGLYTQWNTLTTGNLHKMEIKLSNTVVYQAEVTGAWLIAPHSYYSGDLFSKEV